MLPGGIPTAFADWIDSKMKLGHTDSAQSGSLLR